MHRDKADTGACHALPPKPIGEPPEQVTRATELVAFRRKSAVECYLSPVCMNKRVSVKQLDQPVVYLAHLRHVPNLSHEA